MSSTIEPTTVVIGSVVLISLFVAARVASSQAKHRLPNFLLAAFLATSAFTMSGALFYETGLFRFFPHITRINEPFRFLTAPLLYFYVKSLTGSRNPFNALSIAHIALFGTNLATLAPYLFLSAEAKRTYIETTILPHDPAFLRGNFIWWLFALAQICIYLVLIHREANRFESKIEDNYSYIDKINVKWIHVFAAGGAVFCAILAGVIVCGLSNLIPNARLKPIPLLSSFFLLAFAYKSLKQAWIYVEGDMETTRPGIANSKRTVGRSVIPEEALTEYEARLDAFIEEKRPYLEPELTLKELAEESNIPARIVSQVINEKKHFNFYTFVNFHRLKTVKRMLADPSLAKESILMLAYDAGFNSKATFNAVFKQNVGITPLRYRKQNLPSTGVQGQNTLKKSE
jgi:AraC-like DNA-binding protein